MSGQHCENYDVKRETVHCYPRNVDRCRSNLNVSLAFVSGNIEILGKQNSLFPSGPVIKFLIQTKARRREDSRSANETPLEVNNGGLLILSF